MKCGDDVIVYYERKYVNDFEDAFKIIHSTPVGKRNILFNFYEPDNFIFDSMILDENSKILVLIKFTCNKNAKENYTVLCNSLNSSMRKKTKKQEEKYSNFFEMIEKLNIANKFVFQWLTNECYPELLEKYDRFLAKNNELVNPKKFVMYHYSQDLLDEIAKNK